LGDALLPSSPPELSKKSIDILKDLNRNMSIGNNPSFEELAQLLMKRYKNHSRENIEEALSIILEMLLRRGLVENYHDSLGYPYWKLTDSGKKFLVETYK
jgi:hypothetical protein